MPMLTKPQLLKAIKQGDLMTVKNECVLYGKIIALRDWEIDDIPRYNGCWRQYKIEHKKTQWEIKMHNGEVVSVSYNCNGYDLPNWPKNESK